MKTNIGLWINYQKAEIIVASDHQESVSVVWCGVAGAEEEMTPREKTQFYKKVIAQIQDASTLLIFGPDDAKRELQLQLEQSYPAPRTVSVELTEPMTPRQIMLKVRNYFRESWGKHSMAAGG